MSFHLLRSAQWHLLGCHSCLILSFFVNDRPTRDRNCLDKSNYWISQGRLKVWTEHLRAFFLSCEPARIWKNCTNIIWISLENAHFQKFQDWSSKIVPAMPFWILKFKRAWQAQFLSHILVTLKKCVFFIGVQMILVSFFDISDQKSVISKKLIFLFNVIP